MRVPLEQEVRTLRFGGAVDYHVDQDPCRRAINVANPCATSVPAPRSPNHVSARSRRATWSAATPRGTRFRCEGAVMTSSTGTRAAVVTRRLWLRRGPRR
jgi:hypothetical protein